MIEQCGESARARMATGPLRNRLPDEGHRGRSLPECHRRSARAYRPWLLAKLKPERRFGPAQH